ncbi:MAG: glutaredoxin domain-containing protein [Pseudomonadota bacterium]
MTKILSVPIGIIIMLLAYTTYSHKTSEEIMKQNSYKEGGHIFTIYSIEGCMYCERALEFFKTKKLNFKNIDITSNPDQWNKLKNETKAHTVPYIFIDEKYIGGCSDLIALDSSGELGKILK